MTLRAIRLFASKIAEAVIEGRALATEQDFAVQEAAPEAEEAPIEDTAGDFSKYLDPQYSEQLMSESLDQSNPQASSLTITPPGAVPAEESWRGGAVDS
jgi:small subunit ribosomal protein S2